MTDRPPWADQDGPQHLIEQDAPERPLDLRALLWWVLLGLATWAAIAGAMWFVWKKSGG